MDGDDDFSRRGRGLGCCHPMSSVFVGLPRQTDRERGGEGSSRTRCGAPTKRVRRVLAPLQALRGRAEPRGTGTTVPVPYEVYKLVVPLGLHAVATHVPRATCRGTPPNDRRRGRASWRDARPARPPLGSYEDPIALWGLPYDVDTDAYGLDACDATIYATDSYGII